MRLRRSSHDVVHVDGQLSDYLDGELGPLRRRRVWRHLRHCPQCRQMAESLRRTIRTLQELGHQPPEPRPAVVGAVLAAIAEEAR